MMNNLFSIFDPTSTQINLSLNWISILIPTIIFQYSIWIIPSRMNKLFKNIYMNFNKEMTQMLASNSPSILFISMMMTIFINNFMGLMPYIFTSTSHILITLSLSLMFWISFNMYGWMKKSYHMLIHLVPMGTPNLLMPFMVIIESISNLIRPITLSIRLMANMTAGHILISLLSSTCQLTSIYFIPLIIFFQMFLMMLEMAVAIIQAYVFTTLISLYYNEIN